VGPRPPFRFRGDWLYADGLPVIHLIDAAAPAPKGESSAHIDHIALRVDSGAEWAGLLNRIRLNKISYELAEVPLTGEIQLFVALTPGLVIEFITALP
jgi:hypothetical protein